jgi:hypothetical protein
LTISGNLPAVTTTAKRTDALGSLIQFPVHQLQQSTQKALHHPQRGAKGIDCIHELHGELFEETFIYPEIRVWRHGWRAGWLAETDRMKTCTFSGTSQIDTLGSGH